MVNDKNHKCLPSFGGKGGVFRYSWQWTESVIAVSDPPSTLLTCNTVEHLMWYQPECIEACKPLHLAVFSFRLVQSGFIYALGNSCVSILRGWGLGIHLCYSVTVVGTVTFAGVTFIICGWEAFLYPHRTSKRWTFMLFIDYYRTPVFQCLLL